MAVPSQHTQANSADSIVSRVVGYVKNRWSNRRWASELEQIEKDLQEKLADFAKKSMALVKRKAALAEKQKVLGEMFAKVKEARSRLQCAQDTFRVERQVLREETMVAAKEAVRAECDAMRQRAVKELESVNTALEQKQAELLILETKLQRLHGVLAGVTETLTAGLTENTASSHPVVASENNRQIYLVPKQDASGETTNEESHSVDVPEWTPSLFATEKQPALSSSAVISSAALLRVGG